MEDAISYAGYLLAYGSAEGKVDLATAASDDHVMGTAFATTKDPITEVAGTDVLIGVIGMVPGLEVYLKLMTGNQAIAYGDPLALSASVDGEVDKKDGSTCTNILRAHALEAKDASAAGHIKARLV
jgi:hypothetical protein